MDNEKKTISVGDYGVCNWYPEHGESLIDVRDLERFISISPAGKVFQCTGIDGIWLKLTYGVASYRVHRKVFTPIPSIRFEIGQLVSAAGKTGVVTDIIWHYKNVAPVYFLSFGGKRSSRRYFEEDLLEVRGERPKIHDNSEESF